jgi:putative ABC transport system permease protein
MIFNRRDAEMFKDIRFSVRNLRKRPVFALVVVLTLALGIGANTTIFSVVNAVLLSRLPFREPSQLVTLWERNPAQGYEQNAPAAGNYVDWRAQSKSFTQLAIYDASRRFNLAFEDRAERLTGAAVSTSLFEVLGLGAIEGRVFAAEEEQEGRNQVAIISHNFRQSHYPDRNPVGETIALDGRNHTIVGVMPPAFQFPGGTGTVLGVFAAPRAEIWIPLVLDQQTLNQRSAHSLQVIGRLKPDVTLAQATTELSGIQGQIERAYPTQYVGSHVKIVPLEEQVAGSARRPVLVLWGAVGFVLLICCLNIANLLLTHSASRSREMAVRSALGAGRGRIVRQLLTESLLLAVAGGTVGTFVAVWGVRLLATFVPADFPRRDEIAINLSVLSFTLIISVVTGLVFGLFPALQSSRFNLVDALKSAARGAIGSGRSRLRRVLVVAEVGVALTLLIGASLMIRSFVRLQQVKTGFDSSNTLAVELSLPGNRYTRQLRPGVIAEMLERVRSIPGVESVAAARSLPLSGDNMNFAFDVEGRPFPEGRSPGTDVRFVTPDYLKTLHIPILKGRSLGPSDALGAPNALLINETMSREFFPGEEPIGKRLILGVDNFTGTIVGVIGDVRHESVDAPVNREVYVNYAQAAYWRDMTLLVRTTGNPTNLSGAVREQIKAIDSQIPVSRIRTMDAIAAESVSQPRFRSLLLGVFGLTALLLAAIGIYGVMSYAVTQRTNEIGIRMALGANVGDVRRLVLGNGMTLAIVGIVVGLAGAFSLTRVMQSLLFETSTTDVATFVGASLVVAVVALVACYIPARRATKVDPLVALRSE